MELEVRTVLFCLIWKRVAPDGPTADPLLVASAFEKVTIPKSAIGTRDVLSMKSSTIHSALYSHRRSTTRPLNVWVTDSPVEIFLIVAVPVVWEVAFTVTLIIFPEEMVMLLKLWA
jgi:hypothetical protein